MDKAKKKRIKRYVTWACIAALVAGLTVMPLLAKSEAEADGPVASILSAQAQTGAISSALSGGGTLLSKGEETVTIPTEVKITEFLVKNGQVVTKGTPVAAVDKVSVMNAILGVTDTLEYLQEELEDARDETVASSIYATAGGRVKKIFAQKGESVQEVMLRDGCLVLLSIDGLMAVRIENEVVLTTGEAVTVQFLDGTQVEGRVESSLNGVKVITVEDEGYIIGEDVTVTTGEGELVGSGPLYVHNAWKATAYSGTISNVNTQEERTLSSGSLLFTLTDTEYRGQLQHRANQHREYEQLLQKLMSMYESGVATAPCDGVISGVDSDSAHLLTAEGETGYQILLLSSVACSNSENCEAEAADHVDTCPMKCTKLTGCPAKKHDPNCIALCTHADAADGCTALNHYTDCIRSCTKLDGCKASKHYEDCISLCVSAATEGSCTAKVHKTSCIEKCSKESVEGVCLADAHHHKADCVESCTASQSVSENCTASKHKSSCFFYGMTYTAYAVKVSSVGTNALVGYTDGVAYTVERSGSGWAVAGGGAISETTLVNAYTLEGVANASSFQSGDIVLMVSGSKNGSAVWSSVELYSRSTASETPGTGTGTDGALGGAMGGLSGMTGGFRGSGNTATAVTPAADEGLYDLEGSVLLTVTPQDTMEVTITLDEQDIAKVRIGMEAQVKVVALRGETFPAKITKIGTIGTNNGGSSKFDVVLTLPGTETMLSGMSVTVQIPLETKENVLTIPLAALNESGAKTLVYTALDEKTGDPSSPVEVVTGISDGENVEILSGLNPGDTVYYSYYDTLELDTSAEAERFTLR